MAWLESINYDYGLKVQVSLIGETYLEIMYVLGESLQDACKLFVAFEIYEKTKNLFIKAVIRIEDFPMKTREVFFIRNMRKFSLDLSLHCLG